jgi:hypothetical protein
MGPKKSPLQRGAGGGGDSLDKSEPSRRVGNDGTDDDGGADHGKVGEGRDMRRLAGGTHELRDACEAVLPHLSSPTCLINNVPEFYYRLTFLCTALTIRLQSARLSWYQLNRLMLNLHTLFKILFLSAWILTLSTIAFGNVSGFHPTRLTTLASPAHASRAGWSRLTPARAVETFVHGRGLRHGSVPVVVAKAAQA